MRAHDTDEEASRRHIEAYRRLGPEGRMIVMNQMCIDLRVIATAGIAQRHPDYSAEQARDAYLRVSRGYEIFSKAFRVRALLAP